MKQTDTRNIEDFSGLENETRGIGSRRIERREWWLSSTAIAITLLLTFGIISFLPVLLHSYYDWEGILALRQAVWGLLGMVLLFDLYTIYQQLQIHRIRRQLEAKEKLFRLITENAADMIAVVDTGGKRIYNSLSYQKVLGYSPAELQRSSAFEQIHPDDREQVAAAGEEARRTGKGKALEYRMRHKDGTWRVLESTASVIRSGKGEPDLLVIVNRDVTGRKQAEDALRAQHDLLRTMIDNMPDYIYVKDDESRFVVANRALADLVGAKNPEDLLGKADFDYFPRELATAFYSDERAILQSGQPLVNQ
ncbi:MAG: PAS domain-containing protein, partial [Terracidiphilus sp.]